VHSKLNVFILMEIFFSLSLSPTHILPLIFLFVSTCVCVGQCCRNEGNKKRRLINPLIYLNFYFCLLLLPSSSLTISQMFLSFYFSLYVINLANFHSFSHLFSSHSSLRGKRGWRRKLSSSANGHNCPLSLSLCPLKGLWVCLFLYYSVSRPVSRPLKLDY